MKLVYNIEFSHVKEVVISRKVFYVKDDRLDFNIDKSRTDEITVSRKEMPEVMSSDEMADYVRDYIGRNKWKIVFSTGTINIFKPGKHKPEKSEVKKPIIKTKKGKK